MRAIQPSLKLFQTPFLHPKHTTRIQFCTVKTTSPTWTRAFHASTPLHVVDLAYRLHDDNGKATGDPIVMIHGLFGSKRNNQSVANVFARTLARPVYALDTRNHGDSPHHKTHNYTAMATDVESFLVKHNLQNPTLIGHSMGAKIVMTMALRNPDCCANIIPVDNAPVDAALSSDFPKYAQGMRAVEAARPKSMKEADAVLQPFAQDLAVRQFLLTNLVRGEPGAPLKFRIPVHVLSRALDDMADFPYRDPEETRFDKRALFIRGTRSRYVSDETLPVIGRFFPRFELVDVECGHWVISEKPEEFINAVVEFLRGEE
ncbi:alpha/beta-hydrolase [Plenodomus tracheiphilus IPT5]|uniref:Alpha/beta-hydrolase n=1 Tax=Plenodomus tracheiphilus IPT5 TaxID=1408161 RepID=A0A6A7BHW2_9PLEO|nr:alpha/beta-hydrolase [Plenodomus tracheiphilus IPT5]